MLVTDFLESSAERDASKVALVCQNRRHTYGDIETLANRLARGLIARGVTRNTRVVICLGNRIEAVVAVFATLKAGATFVPINPGIRRNKLTYIVADCEATCVVADARTLGEVGVQHLMQYAPSVRTIISCGDDGQLAGNPEFVESYFSMVDEGDPSCPPRRNIDLDLACLIYTSGSTGEPKGVMCDHSNVVFAASSIINFLENTEEDVVLNALPLSFDYGLYQLLMTFKFGGTLVLERSFAYPAAILKTIGQERVTGLPGVPTLFTMLLQLDLSLFDLSSVRYVTNTAAALAPAHVAELRRFFPLARLFSMYGLTETKRTLYLPPELVDSKPGSVGVAIPGTEVWIEDEHGNQLGPGATGELVVRGRHVMRGYWRAPDATARRFRPGTIPGERWCHTGDLFRMDEDGCMYFVARMDDIIKSRGEKVAPKEIETVLYNLPGITHAAVFGVPDALLGQAIKAVVVVSDASLTEMKVLAHCRAHLEDFMVPKRIEFMASMPLNASGKIDKIALLSCVESPAS